MSELKVSPMLDYVSGDPAWRYPIAGHPKPPVGASVLLLTIGDVQIEGPWSDDGRYKAWSPKPKRNKDLERRYGLLEDHGSRVLQEDDGHVD